MAERKGEPMDDLISRQAAIDAFLTELTKRERKNLLHTWSTVEVKYFVVDMLEKSPSAQPEIIRCKDCKHFAGEGMYCSCDIIVQFDHFYCYHAERRQDV